MTCMLKSDTVKWITVEEPHKRKRVLKNYKDIKLLHDNDPNSQDILAPNIIDDIYPKRPKELEYVCLYEFIQWCNRYGIGHSTGYTKCVKRLKPILFNHRLFDTSKEDQVNAFCYSLLLLCVPFRDESALIFGNSTTKQAYNRLKETYKAMSIHHEKIQKMVTAQRRTQKINELRQEQDCTKAEDNTELPIPAEIESTIKPANSNDGQPDLGQQNSSAQQ